VIRNDDGRPRFDLQAHSTHSDGSLSPREVVARAREAGVELLALTDHDTVSGVAEAVAAGRIYGVRVVPAVEISAIYGRYEDLHILGYGIEHRSPELLDALGSYRRDRAARAQRMLDALKDLGFAVDNAVLDRQVGSGGSVGRPHLARAVAGHPANAERLADEGLKRPEQILQAYLLPGRPGYRARMIPSAREAIDQIHAAGGVAVWAHPFWDIEAPAEVQETLEAFVGFGLDGVETFYVTHDRMQVEMLDDACRAFDLLSTGSSDFHGPDHAIFAAFRRHALHDLEPNLGAIPSAAAAPAAVGRGKE
jgi:predicted metal-dependent phosphoesterase TrpH